MAEVVHKLEETGAGARIRKRRWGYLVWLIAALVIGVPEIIAAKWSHWLPFTTISGMTGHPERHHDWVELIVVALIALVVFSLTRLRPQYRAASTDEGEGADQEVATNGFRRTPGGRVTGNASSAPSTAASPSDCDNDLAPALFTLTALVSVVAIALGTWAAPRWWDDTKHYQPAYVLYGSLGLLWILVPSFAALIFERDVPFPTLFRTIGNLEGWLEDRSWPWALGPKLAWIVAYLIFAGLAILLLHLTLYPFPSITHILNPNG